MRRNPLLRRFQTLFADFEDAERTGRPVAQVREQRRRADISRRDFLKYSGAAVGAAAFAPSTAIAAVTRAAQTQGRIAIVGGGIAGLNAALTLQDAGLSCEIYEASNRIGGRMHSDTTTWADGMVSEWCGEFIDGDHETMHQLIERVKFRFVGTESARPNLPAIPGAL